jgi:hypothetical protein
MAEPEQSPLADLKEEAIRLGLELREMALVRWQLARLEAEAAVGGVRRLAIVLAIAASMALTALPLAAVGAAEVLDQHTKIPRVAWLAIFALVLLPTGVLTGWLTWRHFRRHFVFFQETREELREDGLWLREWLGGGGGQ